MTGKQVADAFGVWPFWVHRWSKWLDFDLPGSGNKMELTQRQAQALWWVRQIIGSDSTSGALARTGAQAVLNQPGRYVVAHLDRAVCVSEPETVVAVFHAWDDEPITVLDLDTMPAVA